MEDEKTGHESDKKGSKGIWLLLGVSAIILAMAIMIVVLSLKNVGNVKEIQNNNQTNTIQTTQ